MRDQRGAFSVELVLLVPLLLVLVFLIFEFGRVFGQWLSVTNAAREGARFAITQPFDPSSDSSILSRVVGAAQGLESSLQAVACQNNQPPAGSTSCIGITRVTCPNTNYSSLCGTTSERFVIILVRDQVSALMPITGAIPFVGRANYPSIVTITGLSTMRAF
jgi:Flp pilus assembly protein TadG